MNIWKKIAFQYALEHKESFRWCVDNPDYLEFSDFPDIDISPKDFVKLVDVKYADGIAKATKYLREITDLDIEVATNFVRKL